MFEPVRGGTRGGQAEFKWSDVSADKDRENYLGHSINAPTGRWQKNKDIHWYNRDQDAGEKERQAEIRRVKHLEAEALAAALGLPPPPPLMPEDLGEESLDRGPSSGGDVEDKEEKKRRKAEKREEKSRRKEERRARKESKRETRSAREREVDNSGEDDYSRRRKRSRSASPQRSYARQRASVLQPPSHHGRRGDDSRRRRREDSPV
ncbi:kinase phosphorylation protein-domain-containing protein [Coprinopsis sp. MPI-PUGE-AT-0042]|nr:kinase phosphorylation protein-domain-containing protein [Coprinopsis sp. MPI-PUGE-AT-0042]